jgi:hypothetical protein
MKQHPQNLLLAAICLGLAACATNRPQVPEAPIKAPAPAPRVIGVISLINEELGFALVQTTETPEIGTPLQARSKDGRETAVLRVSAAQKRPFLIADILKGKAHVGEVVTK